jgi:hypothetical protein
MGHRAEHFGFRILDFKRLNLQVKPGTRPEGVGLSPGKGRRNLLIYELETPVSVIRSFRMDTN